MKILGIIPARLAATRFPNKPMKSILGIPMVGHCYYRSKLSKLVDEVYVASCDKEIIEYLVIDKGSDIVFTETNTTKTGSDLVSSSFDFDPSSNVRLSVTLDTGLTVGDTVFVTIVKTITKR